MANETRTGADLPKGMAGIKNSEYVPIDRVLDNVPANEIPDTARAYMKEAAMPLGGRVTVVNVYRLVDDGGTKNKRSWVAKYARRPEDSEIAEAHGPGKYVWLMKWSNPDGSESGIVSEAIDIDESARPMHEAYLRKRGDGRGADSIPAPVASGVAVQTAPGGQLTAKDMMDLLNAGEEKAIRTMERMAAIMKPADSPAALMKDVYAGTMDMMAKSLELNFGMAKAATTHVREKMEYDGPEGDDDDGLEAEAPAPAAAPGVPEFLVPFMPQIKTYLGTLLGGGPMGGAVKTLIINSEQWKEIFRDKEKWGMAVAAMEQEFGSENTSRALDVLLNRRAEKAKAEKVAAAKVKESSKGKGKGK